VRGDGSAIAPVGVTKLAAKQIAAKARVLNLILQTTRPKVRITTRPSRYRLNPVATSVLKGNQFRFQSIDKNQIGGSQILHQKSQNAAAASSRHLGMAAILGSFCQTGRLTIVGKYSVI
jgi:hypothetical protein